MLVPFETLAAQSKIWIYQSNKKLDEAEKDFIIQSTEKFLADWTAHGNSLQAGVEIAYDQFIIIGVNEAVNEASGCSIDKSVSYVRELGKALNINLLERSQVAIKNNSQIQLIGFTEIKKMVSEGVITSDTEVFNNAVTSKEELKTSWQVSAENSWLKRYL